MVSSGQLCARYRVLLKNLRDLIQWVLHRIKPYLFDEEIRKLHQLIVVLDTEHMIVADRVK